MLKIALPNKGRLFDDVKLALADAGVVVEGLTLRTPTLDDVFLHITGGRLQDGEE